MRILILGAGGMLGHELLSSLLSRHDVIGALRRPREGEGVDAQRFETVERALSKTKPEAVVNAIGIVKQNIETGQEEYVYKINAEFPHKLAAFCGRAGIRVLHISTDCVFSGDRGMYRETDQPDATDLYGKSKLAGELARNGCITLRTSMIGLEVSRRKSLVEWFLQQEGPTNGYRRAVFSGPTSMELARVIERVLVDYPDKSGLYHVSGEPIDKYSLLSGLRDRLGLSIEIRPDDSFECNRSLDSTRFRSEFDYKPPSWNDMLDELCERIRLRKE